MPASTARRGVFEDAAGAGAAEAIDGADGGFRAQCFERKAPVSRFGAWRPELSDDALLDAMMSHPILINRPIVVTPKGVRFAGLRKPCIELLPVQHGEFVKEDGERLSISDIRRPDVRQVRRSSPNGWARRSCWPQWSARESWRRGSRAGTSRWRCFATPSRPARFSSSWSSSSARFRARISIPP